MISCPNCGSNPRFDIESQKLRCPHCGAFYDVESFPEEESGADMQEIEGEYVGRPEQMKVTIFTCSQCGGELMSTDSDAAAFCSYCGSHQILEERLSVQERPKRIIPFKITKNDCKKAYEKKLRMNPFAPGDLGDPTHIDEFRGIYMPYWYYNFTQKGSAKLTGTVEHRSGDYKIIDSYNLSVDEDNVFKGITHDASTTFDDKISESLAPYDTRETVPFRTAYLSGFYADIPDVKSTTYKKEMAAVAARDTLDRIKEFKEFEQYSIKDMNDTSAIAQTHTVMESAESVMFPVWFLSHRNKDRVAYAAINGQTGKMTADIPIDPIRYLIGTFTVAAIIWLILQAVNISSLRGTLMTVVFGAMAGALVYGMVVHKLDEDIRNREWESYLRKRLKKEREKNEKADPGHDSTEKSDEKKAEKSPEKTSAAPGIIETAILWIIAVVIAGILIFFGLEWLIIIEPILIGIYVQLGFSEKEKKRGTISNWALAIATALGVFIYVINPYIDVLYYGCCVFMMLCVVWCFFDALYYYNQLMTRPLPQFQKQGGDDRA